MGKLGRVGRVALPSGFALLACVAVAPVARAAAPAVSIAPSSYDFGTVAVGGGAASPLFVLTNTGTADLHLQSVSITGPNATDFHVALDQCSFRTVPAGSSCNEGANFNPKETGALTAFLTFPDDAAGSPQTVTLTGTGTGPVVTFTPAQLEFDFIPVGQQSAPQTFYVKNTGDSPLTISSATPLNGGVGNLVVTSDGCSGTTVPAGGNCAMSVAFQPTSALFGGAPLRLQTNTASGFADYNVSVSGLGALAQVYAPNANYGSQPQGSRSLPQFVQLQNAGNLPLHVGSVALSGTGASQFVITSDACTGTTVDPGNSACRVFVAFAPNVVGAVNAIFTFNDDAPGGSQSASLQGAGVAPGAIPSQSAIDFGVAVVGGAGPSQVVQLANTTSQPLHVTSASVTNPGTIFTIGNDSCTSTTVPAASSCSVKVTFTPPFVADITGTLTFSDDSGQQTVALAGQGIDPQMSYAPDRLDFGNQRMTTKSAAQAFTVTNTGSTTWTPAIASQPVGDNPADFVIDRSQCAQALAPGASCQLLVTFAPTARGARDALVEIQNPVTQSISKLPVDGAGVAAIIPANSAPFFGSARVGTTLAGNEMAIPNAGTDVLHITSAAISGPDAGSFAIQPNDCVGAAIAPNQACFIPINFTPSATGTLTATLSIVDDAFSGPSQFALKGTGIQSHATFTPSSVTFPDTKVGQSATQSIAVMSDGTASLDVSSAAIVGSGAAAYAVMSDTCVGLQLPATIGCSITVAFAPPAFGPFPASLQVFDDAAGSPQAIALGGNGLQDHASASPSAVSFGGLRPGAAAPPQPVTLTNDGTQSVNVSSVGLAGDASFSVVGDSCTGASLATGASCVVQVGFTPPAVGAFAATLSFNDDAANAPQTVTVNGSGVQPGVSLSTSSIDFGDQVVGTSSAPTPVVVTNSGTDTLNVGSASTAAPFAISSDGCSSRAVAPGSSCTFQVVFSPTAAGPSTGTLSIPDDAPGSPQPVSLSGTGVVVPSVATTLSGGAKSGASITVSTGATISDQATFTGLASNAGGTVSYEYTTDAKCAAGLVSAGTANVSNGAAGPSNAVSFSGAGTYYWIAIYSGDASTYMLGASSACGAEVLTVQSPSLGIGESADAANVSAGQSIGFTVTLTNAGPGDASGVSLSDALPAGGGVNWSIASATGPATCAISGAAPAQSLACNAFTLAAGQSETVHVTSPTTGASCVTFTNAVTFSSSNGGGGGASAAEAVSCPNLTLTKTADHGAPVMVGTTIGFIVGAANSGAAGTGTASGLVLQDVLPSVPSTIVDGFTWVLASTPILSGADLVTQGVTCQVEPAGATSGQTLWCGTGANSQGVFSMGPGDSISVHVTHRTDLASAPRGASATYANGATLSCGNEAACALAAGASETVQAPVCEVNSSTSANFKGTAIAAGSTIWFNSSLKVSGLPANAPVTIGLFNASVTFTANGKSYTVPIPNTRISYSPTATTASTTFDASTQSWVTTLPSAGPGNQFLSGVGFPVPAGGLPGGIGPVKWSGTLTSDTHGVSIGWQWSAAVYTSFSSDLNALGVKPVDSNSQSVYKNSDRAGTPENYKAFLTAGAESGGGNNFTGSYGPTAKAGCP